MTWKLRFHRLQSRFKINAYRVFFILQRVLCTSRLQLKLTAVQDIPVDFEDRRGPVCEQLSSNSRRTLFFRRRTDHMSQVASLVVGKVFSQFLQGADPVDLFLAAFLKNSRHAFRSGKLLQLSRQLVLLCVQEI